VSKISVYSKISNEIQASCAAWSPKGKQIAIGCKNGDIVQLKPDTLKVARIITGPSPFIGEVINILWISNYQFCAAYSNNERHINVLIIDAPKGETNATFTCYEDITYGCIDTEEEESILRYYFEYVPEWGFIIAGSSTSSEIAVLGTTDGGINWNQWQLVDSGRAQLPLMRTTEIYPIGLAVDKSPTNILSWGTDSSLLYPVPILHILGTSGRLCSFHMVNLMPNCPTINSPPTEIVAIPTPPHPIVSQADISFSMNTVVTSTPRPKQSEIMPQRPKPAPMTNIFGESLKTTGFFQHTVEQATEQPKPQEEKSILVTNAKSVTPKETLESEPLKPEIKLAVDKGVSSSQAIEQKAAVDDSIRMRAFLQEQMMFEKELRNRLQPQVWECGTDEEKKRLGETSAVIEQFLRDLKDTINSLSSDIAYLKALLLQSFAWIEETKSKNAASADITSRNCSENSKITDLQRWYYYTQTQLNQVSKILDLEWSEHKAQKKTKMKIPSLEFVYQNLLIHNKICAKEKEKFEQILRQWKSLNRSLPYTVNVSSLNRSMVNLHVSSPKLSMIRGKTNVIEARCKTIVSKTLNFTHEKQIKLKALLIESHPRIVKPINPSPIQDRLKATLSSLASLNPAEIKPKTELSVVKQNIITNKQIEKPIKSQNPLASLNSIVARIGSSDTSGIMQNKTQQKPLPTTSSFSATISTKQMDKKSSVATTSAVQIQSQSKLKQDLGISFPSSITFGMSAQKSQDALFPKSALMDVTSTSNKEPTINDNISTVPESVLFSTGILKDALSAEYPLNIEATRIGIAHNLPSPSIPAPVVKMDNAATFNFATSNTAPNLMKNTSSNIDTMSSASKSITNISTIELPTTTTQLSMQSPIELSTLSSVLESSNSLTLPSNNADGKMNMITSTSFVVPVSIGTTQTSAMTAIATPTTNIGDITVSTHPISPNSIRKTTQVTPVADTLVIEKVTTPEIKAVNFGSISAQVPSSLSTIFGGQTIAKNIAEVTTTLSATTTFDATVFPSMAPTFGMSTIAPTASVLSGLTSTSTGIIITPISSTAPINTTMSSFQSSLNKPTFSETTITSMPTPNFSINSSNTSAGVSFGPTTTTSITTTMTTTVAAISPTFCKNPIASPISNAQFLNTQTPASSANIFEKPVISPASTPFGNTSSSVFSTLPVTSSNTSIFGGSSMNSVFGSSPLSSTSGNIFGGNLARFDTPTSGSIFDTNAPKSGIIFGGATNTASASPFNNATSNTSPMAAGASANVFSSTVTNTSPIQQPVLSSQSTFGQAPTFGAKPVFGSCSIFGGSKPVFGGNSFGSSATFESSGIGK